MKNEKENEAGLNSFGKKLETILQSQGMEIQDLASYYPVSEDDTQKNLYDWDYPSQEYSTVIFAMVKMKDDQRASLKATLHGHRLKVA